MHNVGVRPTRWASLLSAGLVVPLLIGFSVPAASAQGTGAQLSFKWAFVRLAEGGQEQVVDFSTHPVVRAGDQLQVYLEPLSRIYLYLFLFDSSRDLALLYPPAPRASPATAGETIFLPGEGRWFTIDEKTGEEQFFLLASAARLPRLEDLTSAWLRKPGDAEAKARVLDEIKDLRRRHSAVTGIVEKAVPMAGTFAPNRGPAPAISGDATEVEAEGFYARTLRLKHE